MNEWEIIGLILSSFLLSSLLFWMAWIKMTASLKELTELVKDLKKGHYWRRIYPQENNSIFSELMMHTNDLAIQLQKNKREENKQETRRQAIIKHMSSGLMFIDHHGKIVLTNKPMLDMLQWNKSCDQMIYYEAPLPEAMSKVIQDTFTYELEFRQHLTLSFGHKQWFIDFFAAPVKDEQGNLTGVLLVCHDITDIKKLEKIRQDFVANVSHELKTPLTSIKGFTETLLDGAMYSEEHLHQFLNIIHKEAERLDRLVHDLLELSNIEQKSFQLYWQDVDLSVICQEIIHLLEDVAERKQIDLVFEHTQQAIVQGDADRIRQIILNLVSNAVQYSKEQGRVEVKIQPWEKQGFRVCVQDDGIGIESEELPRIFERFYRVDKARSRVSGGTGLGLAIVKHLVEAHQGEISVTSEEGKGSTFCVSFYTLMRGKGKP